MRVPEWVRTFADPDGLSCYDCGDERIDYYCDNAGEPLCRDCGHLLGKRGEPHIWVVCDNCAEEMLERDRTWCAKEPD